MARRRLGHLPDPSDSRDVSASELLAAPRFPEAATLAGHVPALRDQGRTSSCVAQALAVAIDVRESRAGLPHNPISRLFVYWNSRADHGAQYRDRGTHIRTACKQLQKLGAPPEPLWRWRTNPITVRRMPAFGAYRGAFNRRIAGAGYYRIGEVGAARLDRICEAIASGFPVVFGTGIARSFFDDDGSSVYVLPPNLPDVIGGHAMCIVGYETLADGARRFRVVNSWGPGWRDSGLVWLSDKYVAWGRTRDVWIVEGWPMLERGAQS